MNLVEKLEAAKAQYNKSVEMTQQYHNQSQMILGAITTLEQLLSEESSKADAKVQSSATDSPASASD